MERFLVCLLGGMLAFFPAAQLNAGEERFDYDELGRLIRAVDELGRVTDYTYDPAGNLLKVTTGGAGSIKPPTISGINPEHIRRGETKPFRISGANLKGARLSIDDPGMSVSDVRASDTQIDFNLGVADTAILGPQPIGVANAGGNTSVPIIVSPRLPKASVAPAPLAIPPDSIARQITIRLSNADNIDHSFALSVSDPSIVSVSPATLTIAAGQTQANATVAGLKAGLATITLGSATLGNTLVPVFVTAEFKGINTSFAPPLGVVVEEPPKPKPTQTITPFAAPHLGVVLGSHLLDVNPKSLVAGTGPIDVVIWGKGLSTVTDVSVHPADGIKLGSFSVNQEGTAITLPVTVDANAPKTMRQIVLRAGTQIVPAVSAQADRVLVTDPAPEITSIDPLFVVPGTTSQAIVIRGRYFSRVEAVQVGPSTGIAVGASPTVSADGTRITVSLAVSPSAPLGPRVVRVITASGASSAVASPENTLSVVNELKDIFTPITAPIVGVVKESDPPAPPTQAIGLQAAHVGVAVGAVVTGVQPAAESIGETFTMTIAGHELQSVTDVKFLPDTGIAVGSVSIATDGRSLTMPVTLAADAPLTLRTVQVIAGTAVLPPAPVSATQFRVTTPQPQIHSVGPNFIQLGAPAVTHIIRGKNYQNLQQVKIVPPEGVTVGSPAVNGNGTDISVSLSATANAVKGQRAVVVVTPVGETSSALDPANTITLATDAETITPVAAPLLGVVKQQDPPPVTTTIGPVAAPSLGVIVESPAPEPISTSYLLPGAHVGVTLGPVAVQMQPSGAPRGTTANLFIQGIGLADVTSATITPAIGVTVGAPQANVDGTQLTVPLTITSDAPTGWRDVTLTTADGRIEFAKPHTNRFYIGTGTPRFDSIEPILGTQGTATTLLIRGEHLHNATAVTATPADGVTLTFPITVNSTGTQLTVPLHIAPDAALGSRVIQVTTPAGVSSSEAAPANTFTVYPP